VFRWREFSWVQEEEVCDSGGLEAQRLKALGFRGEFWEFKTSVGRSVIDKFGVFIGNKVMMMMYIGLIVWGSFIWGYFLWAVFVLSAPTPYFTRIECWHEYASLIVTSERARDSVGRALRHLFAGN
jgi:hypothetical protein